MVLLFDSNFNRQLRMIRRKNINCSQMRSTSIDHKAVFQQSYDNSRKPKYNYLIHGMQNYNQTVIDKDLSRLSERSRYQIDNPQKNSEEYLKIMSGSEALLRKNELYYVRSRDNSFEKNIQNNYKGVNERVSHVSVGDQVKEPSDSTLRQCSLNRLAKTTNIQSQTTKTIRKADQSCTCSKSLNKDQKAQSQTRCKSKQVVENVKERLISNQDDLDAKYQALWNANQNVRDRSFEHVDRDQFHLTTGGVQSGVIVNTRDSMLRNRRKEHSKEQWKDYQPGSDIRTRQQYVIASENYLNKDQYILPHKKIPFESIDAKRSSTPLGRSRRLDYTLNSNLLGYVPMAPERIRPTPLPCDHKNALRHQTDVRLRMVQDFSSKISMRILELTTSLEEMRRKRR